MILKCIQSLQILLLTEYLSTCSYIQTIAQQKHFGRNPQVQCFSQVLNLSLSELKKKKNQNPLWWIDLGCLSDGHPATLSLPLFNRTGEIKMEKLVDKDQDSLIHKSTICMCKQCEKGDFFCYFPLVGRCPATSWKGASVYIAVPWESKHYKH